MWYEQQNILIHFECSGSIWTNFMVGNVFVVCKCGFLKFHVYTQNLRKIEANFLEKNIDSITCNWWQDRSKMETNLCIFYYFLRKKEKRTGGSVTIGFIFWRAEKRNCRELPNDDLPRSLKKDQYFSLFLSYQSRPRPNMQFVFASENTSKRTNVYNKNKLFFLHNCWLFQIAIRGHHMLKGAGKKWWHVTVTRPMISLQNNNGYYETNFRFKSVKKISGCRQQKEEGRGRLDLQQNWTFANLHSCPSSKF